MVFGFYLNPEEIHPYVVSRGAMCKILLCSRFEPSVPGRYILEMCLGNAR